MAGKENLRTPSSDEAREIGRKGGLASGEARRAKRNLREIFEAIRTEQITVAMPDKSTRTMQMDEAAALAMYQQALKGNVKAMTLVATLLGEYRRNIDISTDGMAVRIEVSSQETAEALGRIIGENNADIQ